MDIVPQLGHPHVPIPDCLVGSRVVQLDKISLHVAGLEKIDEFTQCYGGEVFV